MAGRRIFCLKVCYEEGRRRRWWSKADVGLVCVVFTVIQQLRIRGRGWADVVEGLMGEDRRGPQAEPWRFKNFILVYKSSYFILVSDPNHCFNIGLL